MNARVLALSAVLAIVIGVGAARFPKLLDPGRAEADGISLNLYVYGTVDASPSGTNDWSVARARMVRRLPGARLLVRSGPSSGQQLVSGPLAVFAHRRYVVTVRMRSLPGAAAGGVGVTDGNLTDYLVRRRVPPARRLRTVTITFSTGSRHRVSIVLYGSPGSRMELAGARLMPAP